ncbi:MAG TPA: hypothetical protein VFC09_16520 [Candidatus Dormibacteraeota bacterium]|nr:hypothetical protein [Candidatus Dormibacteraeota bacterium]
MTIDDLADYLARSDIPSPEILRAAKSMLRTDELIDANGDPTSDAKDWLASGQDDLPPLLS